MSQITGALTLELDLDRLAEKVAVRVAELLTERDPHQGTSPAGRGHHEPDELGLGGLAGTPTTPEEGS